MVYRLDCLSRSLVGFCRINEVFEKHHVLFVSVTEAINATSAHGRMMVNILQSFAQYECELGGERTRVPRQRCFMPAPARSLGSLGSPLALGEPESR